MVKLAIVHGHMSDATPMLTILTPTRNAGEYLNVAVQSVKDSASRSYEHIVIDDGSTDGSTQDLLKWFPHDRELKVVSNPGVGKVAALNAGYSLSSGSLVTTLDADDALHPDYFRWLSHRAEAWDAMIRDYWVTDGSLKPIGEYVISRDLVRCSFTEAVSQLVSIPRASWTITRSIADRVFPIPEELPFEDVWLSLIVRRYAYNIASGRKPMYYYRQHTDQTFGGVLNYRPAITRFRARRLSEYARLLPRLASRFEVEELPDLRPVGRYYERLGASRLPLRSILAPGIGWRARLKLIVFRKLWPLLGVGKRIQWLITSRHTT